VIDKGRILVVEDDPVIRSGIGQQLRRAGYLPFVAATVAEACSRLRNTAVDLILLDLGLPDGSGLDLLAELRSDEEMARIPVVVLTGRDPAEVKAPSLRNGAQIFLRKPARESAILDAIVKLMHVVQDRAPDNLYDWQRSVRRGQSW
jgi:two-component system, OmpR family, response regulator